MASPKVGNSTTPTATFLTDGAGFDNGYRGVAAGVDEASANTLMLQRRKDFREVKAALAAAKACFEAHAAELADRRARLRERQRTAVELVTKYRAFLEENDAKRAKAVAKAEADGGQKYGFVGNTSPAITARVHTQQ